MTIRIAWFLAVVAALAGAGEGAAEFWVVGLGQAHLLFAYVYSARAGKFSPQRFSLAMSVVIGLFVLMVLWPQTILLRTFSAMWFAVHLLTDERHLRGRAADPAMLSAIVALPVAILGGAFTYFIGPRAGGGVLLIALLLSLYAALHTWSDRQRFYDTLDLLVPTWVTVLVLMSGVINFTVWTAILIVYHYMHWYVAATRKSWPIPARRWAYVRDVVLFNAVSITGTFLWQKQHIQAGILPFIFGVNSFYIWTIGHFVFTARVPDVVYLKNAAANFDKSRLSAAFVLGTITGGIGAFGYAGPGILPLYIASLIVLAWVAMREQKMARVVAFAVGFSAAQFMAPFIGAVAWGWSLVLLIMGAMTISITLPTVALARLLRHLRVNNLHSPRNIIAIICLSFGGGALAQSIPDMFDWPIATSAHLATFPLLIAPARWIGMAGLSGCVMVSALLAASALSNNPTRRSIAVSGGVAMLPLFALFVLGSYIVTTNPNSTEKALRVGVPQMNASSLYYRDKVINNQLREKFDQLFYALMEQLQDADLIATPEEFDDVLYPHIPSLLARWQDYAKKHNKGVLLSTSMYKQRGRINAVLAINHNGEQIGVHEKVDLAPIGELDRAPGSDYTVFQFSNNLTIGSLVCMEAALGKGPLDEVRKGANLLATTTSDVAFGSSALVFLHLAMAQIHSAALGRDMIWASNAGPSGYITHLGRYIIGGAFQNADAARFEVHTYNETTPFVAWTSRYGFVMWALLSVVGVMLAQKRRTAADAKSAAAWSWEVPRFTVGWALALTWFVLFSMNLWVGWLHRSALSPRISMLSFWSELPPPKMSKQTVEWYVSGPDNTLAGAASVFLSDIGLPQDWRSVAQWLSSTTDVPTFAEQLRARFGIKTREFDPMASDIKEQRWIGQRADNRWYVAIRNDNNSISVFQPWDGKSQHFNRLPLPPVWNSRRAIGLAELSQ